MEQMKSLLIRDTTREERERIVAESVGSIDGLGDREEKTRNPVMAAVGDRIRELHALLAARGTDCVLEWNPGNHFREPELRTARAFAWLLREG